MASFRDCFDALDLLTRQHAEIDQLFAMIERNHHNRRAAVVELANMLAAHTTIEEKLFYPCILSEDTSKLLHESAEEHQAIKRLLSDLLTDLDADELEAKLAVLREQVAHHAHEEEEAKLFPTVREVMHPSELAMIGDELVVMYEHLMAAEPRRWDPDETGETTSLPV